MAALRLASLGDISALVDLEATFPGDRLSRRSFRHLLTKGNAEVWVLENEGVQADAVVLYRRGSQRARLYSLVVHPEARGRGLGAQLLAAVETAAMERGCKEMRLELREDNGAALSLYQSHGYTVTGRSEGYYDDGSACLHMHKLIFTAT